MDRALHGGGHDGGRKVESLQQESCHAKGGTYMAADADGGHPFADFFDELMFSGDVASARRDAGTRVLDEGAGDEVGPLLEGLGHLRKFGITVIDKEDSVFIFFIYRFPDLAYVGRQK